MAGFLPQLICFGSPLPGLAGAVTSLGSQQIGFRRGLTSGLLSCFGGPVGQFSGEAHRPVGFCDCLNRARLGPLCLVLLLPHPPTCFGLGLLYRPGCIGGLCPPFRLNELVGDLAGLPDPFFLIPFDRCDPLIAGRARPLDPSLDASFGVTLGVLHRPI